MPKTFKNFIVLLIAFASSKITAQEITIGYHNDLDTLRAWVDEIHPWPYSRCSKHEADSAFALAHSEIDSSTSILDFSKLIGRTLGVFSDSHTLINIDQFQSSIANNKGELKIALRYIEGKFFVSKDPNNIIDLGTQIIKINDNPIIEYFNSALSISPTEGNTYTSKVRVATILMLDFALYDIEDGAERIILETSKGEVIDYPIVKRSTNIEKVKSVVEWVWPIEGDSIVTIKVKSFNEGKDGTYYKEVKRGFRKLKRSNYNHLVVDLRGNLGGSATRMKYLLSFIIDEEFAFPEVYLYKQCRETKKNYNDVYQGFIKWVADKFGDNEQDLQVIKKSAHLEIGETDSIRLKPNNYKFKQVFDGNTCLLIDGLSASASVSFASYYKRFNRGDMIGENCMGAMTGTFGNPIHRTLNNSRIGVSIASVAFALDSNLNWHSTPISPFRFIQQSPEEISTEYDPYLSAIDDWYNYPNVSSSFDFLTIECKILFSELESVYSQNRKWAGEMRSEVFDLIVKCDYCIEDYNKKIKEVEKSVVSEDEILESVTELYRRKKRCIELRNAQIHLKLPFELRATFNELIAPNRPDVLHFGIHNRADCNVCIK
ncbi:MAG: hypothetical protein CL847_06505 [Crocinitomicaceae bacterium]|nr:hypothetical protein [Crocinitomicaceae bacterium]|tara:strand:- start:10049 stop:11851 length:1803 start_codon:yes stop_codon:yes gene_type:complete